VSRVGLDHDRATGGQCRRGIAAGNRERQREVRCAEHGDRAQADFTQTQVAARRGAFRQRAVQRGRLEAAIAHDFCEQAQLVAGATALAFQAGLRQAGFLHRAFDQRRTQVHDAVGDGFQELGAHFQAGGAIGVEGLVGQFAGALQVGGPARPKAGSISTLRDGSIAFIAAFFARDRAAADNHFASYLHNASLDV
jgi:hypothetical protein